MATIDEIKQQAEAVKNATQVGENTAERVGGALAGLVDIAKQQDTELGKKAEKSDIAILKDLIRAATGMPKDLLDKMVEYNAVLEQAIPYIRNMSEITESDIDKIIADTYVPEQTNPTPSPDSDVISYVKAIDVKVTDTSKKLDQFIASDLTTEQVNDLLDKQNDNINI